MGRYDGFDPQVANKERIMMPCILCLFLLSICQLSKLAVSVHELQARSIDFQLPLFFFDEGSFQQQTRGVLPGGCALLVYPICTCIQLKFLIRWI